MSGWTVPPNDAVPPRAGVEPPPGVGMHHEPEDENLERAPVRRQRDEGNAEPDAESEQQVSTAELRRDAERTRDRLNQDVVDLRHKFGLDHERGDGHEATGPFAPVRRHPLTVALAAAGATTVVVVGLKMARGRRKEKKRREKDAARRRQLAQRRLADAKDTVIATASRKRPRRGRSGLRSLAHR